MPSKPSPPPPPPSGVDKKPVDPEFEFRTAVLALAGEPGFRLNVALFRQRATRDALNTRLQRELALQQVSLTTLDLRHSPAPVLSQALEAHLQQTHLPAGTRRVIAVLGLEELLGLAIAGEPGGDEQRRILQSANLHRDLLPKL